jgi:ankyrin repeat protein
MLITCLVLAGCSSGGKSSNGTSPAEETPLINEHKAAYFYVTEEELNQVKSKINNSWPKDVYAWSYENNKVSYDGAKLNLSLNNDKSYSFGALSKWKTVPLTGDYVLMFNTSPTYFDDLDENLYEAQISRYNDKIFSNIYVPHNSLIQSNKAPWLHSPFINKDEDTEEGKKYNRWIIKGSLTQFTSALKVYLTHYENLYINKEFKLLPKAESDAYKTYISYLKPAYHASLTLGEINSGKGMTETEINEFIYGELLPALSMFSTRYKESNEFESDIFYQEAIELYDNIIKGGHEILLGLRHKALRNAIVTQLDRQQGKHVITDDYSPIVYAVSSLDINKVIKSIEDYKDVNAHYKNFTPAHQAAKEGFLEALQLLVKQGADVQIRTANFTPLLAATRYKSLSVVKYLIQQGADVNARLYKNLNTSLILAAVDNQPEIVKTLLENNAYLWAENFNGDTAWAWAVSKNNKETLQVFEQFNAKEGFAAYDAIKSGNIGAFRRAVNNLHNVYQIDPKDTYLSLLSSASAAGEIEMVQLLIDQGFDINFSALNGVTAAYMAAKNNKLEVFKLLVESGIDLQKQVDYAPIHTASYRGNLEIVKYLLKQPHIDPLLLSNYDNTTGLMQAVEGNRTKVVKFLLEQPEYYNARLIEPNLYGDTPLITLFKFKHDNREVFELLTKQPWLNKHAKNKEGKSAYDYAKKAGLNHYLNELK